MTTEQPFNHSSYIAQLAQGRLMGSRCIHCGSVYLPPRTLCPNCYQVDMEWVELSGRGTLESFTFIQVGLPAVIAQGFDRDHPYCSGIIRLAEGPVISARVIAPFDTQELQVGMPVEVVFDAGVDLAFVPQPTLNNGKTS